MRVAAIYDIHGNVPALEAVLQEIRKDGVDQIVVGGDVLPGPMPREALALLLELDVPVQFIHGNGETAVLAHLAGDDLASVPERFREIIQWNARQLDAHHAPWLRTWRLTTQLEIAVIGPVLFCHATPRSDTELFTRLTPEERLLPLFQELNVAVVVCGHTHMQFDRRIGQVRVVNAGSVGMPFGDPVACWLRLGPDITLRRTAYDLEAAAVRIRATDYPEAEEFVATCILQPRSEEEMLQLYSKAEQR